MQKRILTQQDIDNNPDLEKWGLKPGDEIGIPETQDDDTGGTNPPPDKPRPDKP